ncbi:MULTISPECIES: hypothetical protein [unclassified Paraburkholderia]|nr:MULTISPECIES: hypothetical protein [unclassified Paraburkholderia]
MSVQRHAPAHVCEIVGGFDSLAAVIGCIAYTGNFAPGRRITHCSP